MTRKKKDPGERKRWTEYAEIVSRLGIPQGKLADILGVRRECICKRINGKQIITIEALFAIRQVAAEHGHNTGKEADCDDLF